MNSSMAAAREGCAAGGGAAGWDASCRLACRWQWMPPASAKNGHELAAHRRLRSIARAPMWEPWDMMKLHKYGASLSISRRLQTKIDGLGGAGSERIFPRPGGEPLGGSAPPQRGSEQIRCSPHPLALLLALLPQLSPKKRRGLTAIKELYAEPGAGEWPRGPRLWRRCHRRRAGKGRGCSRPDHRHSKRTCCWR